MRVRAIESVEYDGKAYKAGDEFEIQDEHLTVLSMLNKVSVAQQESTAEPRRGRYQRRDLRAVE